MAKTKYFRVAVEGATASDGRTIERSWIVDMAAGYNPATYGARINLEHIRGATGQTPFKAMGDVVALKAETVTLSIAGKDEQRLALFAQIDPTDELVALTKDRQKIYTSIEVAPNFAGTTKAGLVGLAVTDTPASLGTEALSFSARTDDAYAKVVKASLDARKTNKDNLFSAALETSIELEPDAAAGADDKVSLSALVTAFGDLFKRAPVTAPTTPAAATPAAEPAAPTFSTEAFTTALTKFGEGLQAAQAKSLSEAITPLKTDLSALQAKVDGTPASDPTRPPASGGQGQFASVDY